MSLGEYGSWLNGSTPMVAGSRSREPATIGANCRGLNRQRRRSMIVVVLEDLDVALGITAAAFTARLDRRAGADAGPTIEARPEVPA